VLLAAREGLSQLGERLAAKKKSEAQEEEPVDGVDEEEPVDEVAEEEQESPGSPGWVDEDPK
jgi:hypothetical protein